MLNMHQVLPPFHTSPIRGNPPKGSFLIGRGTMAIIAHFSMACWHRPTFTIKQKFAIPGSVFLYIWVGGYYECTISVVWLGISLLVYLLVS